MKSKSLVSSEAGTVTRIVGFTIGTFLAFATFGYSAEVVYHGSLCHSTRPQGDQQSYSQWGVGNVSTSNVLVVNCGGALDLSQQNIKTVFVIVYDRNPSADVRCSLTLVDLNGSHNWIGNASSSNANNSPQVLTFQPPVTKAQTIYLRCLIPPMTAAKETSYVTTYRVIVP